MAVTKQLANYERRYRELASRIADIGFVMPGSLIQRHTRCGTPTCRCHADPPQLHGPYWQWTTKVDGKTITRRLTNDEAALYQEWTTNDRELRDLTHKMRTLAAKATAITLRQTKPKTTQV